MSRKKKHDHGEKRQLDRIERKLDQDIALDKQILAGHGKRAKSARLYISDLKGKRLMPATLKVGDTAVAVLHEFTGPNGTGAEMAPIGPVSYSSSDPAIATVDAASGLVTAVAAGTVTITGTDAGNGLSASDAVSDTAIVAQSATLVITPSASAPPA